MHDLLVVYHGLAISCVHENNNDNNNIIYDTFTFLGLLAFLFMNLTDVKHVLLDFPINGDGDSNGVIKRDENTDDDNDDDDDDDDDFG